MEVQEKKVAQVVKALAGDGEGPSRPAWLDRLLAWPQQFKKLVHDVRGEMVHVTWPSLSEVRSTTLIVIVTIFFFGVFFFIVDMGVSKVVALILKHGRS